MAEEEKDSWLEDIDEDGSDSDDFDQSQIDSLLAGGGLDAGPQESVDEDDDGDLDQDDIDSLLAGGQKDGDLGPAEELDQAEIDSLFSNSDDAEKGSDEDPDELDQADIDALLSGGNTPADEDIPDISPDQGEIDRLFSEIDDKPSEADPFQAEEIDFKDVFNESTEEESFLTTGNEFADEEFDLEDDLLEIPDIPEVDEETTVFETKEETSPPPEDMDISPEREAPFYTQEASEKKSSRPGITIPAFLQGRKTQAMAAGTLVLLLLASYFIFSDDKDPGQVAETATVLDPATPPPQLPEEAPAPPNNPPSVTDAAFQMETVGPVLIELTAQDQEGDPLLFEIVTGPAHGSLRGQPPHLIYAPDKEFPGTDQFTFRASDGKDFSPSALVTIAEPPKKAETAVVAEAPPQAPTKPVTIKPRQLVISAKDLVYNVLGTKDFLIDWEKIWDEANYLPYTKQVAVELFTDNLQGELRKVDGVTHKYRAKKYSEGKEVISYRFKLGTQFSKTRRITLNIDPGDSPPEIVLRPFADFYKPGEQVLLDASASRDEERQSLLFSWEQISGIPVQIDVLNSEGSRISFIAPSSFSTVKNPGPLMRLTAVDGSGKKDVRDIKIVTQSRYKSALWGDLAAGGL